MANRKTRRTRPRRRNGFVELVNGVLSLIVFAMLLVGGVLFYGAWQFYGEGPTAEETTFRVEAGNNLSTVATRLEEQGLIANQYIFQLGGRALDHQTNIKAGDFRIPPGSSMSEILRELTQGDPIRYAVTIPEGWTSWEVVQRLNREDNLTGEID